jgi:hypothetical protein
MLLHRLLVYSYANTLVKVDNLVFQYILRINTRNKKGARLRRTPFVLKFAVKFMRAVYSAGFYR